MKAILTYHSIDRSGSPISVSPSAFRRHVKWFGSGRVRVVPIEELLAGDRSERDAVALTFDDGYANIAAEPASLLVDHGLYATVFVVTRWVGAVNSWNSPSDRAIPELPLLGWDALARLAERNFTIGSHTKTHPRLPGLEPAALEEEIDGAARDIERRLGLPAAGFAYPYGDVSPEVTRAVARRHRWACTVRFSTLESPDPLSLPRLDMWYFDEPGVLELWGTSAFRRWIRRRRQMRRVGRMMRAVRANLPGLRGGRS